MIPIEKIKHVVDLIDKILTPRKVKSHSSSYRRFAGFFDLSGRAMVPGRAFTRRLYMFTSQKESGKQLKPHHHIRINQTWDMIWRCGWSSYPIQQCTVGLLLIWRGIGCHWDQNVFWCFTHWDLGFGGVCDDSWMYGRWDGFVQKFEPSIAYLELFAVTATVINWLARFKE